MSNPFEKSWEPTLIVEGGVGRLESLTVKNSQHSLSGTTPPTTEDREEMARRMDWADMLTHFGGGIPSPIAFTGETIPLNSGVTKDPTLDAREMRSRDFPRHPMCRCTLVEKAADPAWDRYFELAFTQVASVWRNSHSMREIVKLAGETADEMLAERQKRMVGDKDEAVSDVTAVRTVGQVVDGRDWLTVAEAMRLGVCRLCKEDINKPLSRPMGPIITSTNHGEEFAHRECLKRVGDRT